MSDDDERFGRSITSIELETLIVNAKAASTIAEIAERYGIARSTVYLEIGRGNLRVKKIGDRSIVLLADEQAWLDNLKTVPAHPSVHSGKLAARRQRRTPARKNGRKTKQPQLVT